MNTVQSHESTRSSLPSQNRFRPRRAIGGLSIALLGLAALFLAGCGGGGDSSSSGGGNSESFVISIDGAADITYSNSASVGAFYASIELLPSTYYS